METENGDTYEKEKDEIVLLVLSNEMLTEVTLTKNDLENMLLMLQKNTKP